MLGFQWDEIRKKRKKTLKIAKKRVFSCFFVFLGHFGVIFGPTFSLLVIIDPVFLRFFACFSASFIHCSIELLIACYL
jgi:hypothetical protein